MISRVRLKNYRSIGELQVIDLQPITVLVGANNSGKSSFLRFVELARNPNLGLQSLWHRPPMADRELLIEWTVPNAAGMGPATWSLTAQTHGTEITSTEKVTHDNREIVSNVVAGPSRYSLQLLGTHVGTSYGSCAAPAVLNEFRHRNEDPYRGATKILAALIDPMRTARDVHLKVDALRADNQLVPKTTIGIEGSGLAGLVAEWQLTQPEMIQVYNDLMSRCLPELRRVLVQCEQPGSVRLFFEHVDGEYFDATQVSDGVLIFAGLIAHALVAPPNGIVLLEEPERGIHPRRLTEFVDLLRTIFHERGTQFIMATHSTALLNLFRDEPENILAFRRTPGGTAVQKVSEMKDLAETLSRADPGELLANGVFNEDFQG